MLFIPLSSLQVQLAHSVPQLQLPAPLARHTRRWVAFGLFWVAVHTVGRLNVDTMALLFKSFDFWLPLLMLLWFAVALLDMLAWRPGQVLIVLCWYLFFVTGLASDAYSFRRSKVPVLSQCTAAFIFLSIFCALAHYEQLNGLNASIQHDVGGLKVNVIETASSRALASALLWARLIIVVGRRPHEAGVLRCSMQRTLVTKRSLQELKARWHLPLVFPEGMVVDHASGTYSRGSQQPLPA